MSKFKDSQNRWLTLGLFYEVNNYKTDFAQFTVDDEPKTLKDGKVLAPIRQMYLACSDPTEYEFATTYLGGWPHWKAIQECKPLQPYIEQWREELEARLRSEALEQIIDKAKSKNGYQAAQFLVNRGWKVRGAGAPSKEEKDSWRKQDKAWRSTVEEDAERLGIKVVK